MIEHLTEVGVGAATGILTPGSGDTVHHGGEGIVECHLHSDKRLQCGLLTAWSARKQRARARRGASLESSSLTSIFLCLPIRPHVQCSPMSLKRSSSLTIETIVITKTIETGSWNDICAATLMEALSIRAN